MQELILVFIYVCICYRRFWGGIALYAAGESNKEHSAAEEMMALPKFTLVLQWQKKNPGNIQVLFATTICMVKFPQFTYKKGQQMLQCRHCNPAG